MHNKVDLAARAAVVELGGYKLGRPKARSGGHLAPFVWPKLALKETQVTSRTFSKVPSWPLLQLQRDTDHSLDHVAVAAQANLALWSRSERLLALL